MAAPDMPPAAPAEDPGIGWLDLAVPLARHRWALVFGPLAAGLAALAVAFAWPPTFTATTSFLPPQPPQSAAATALASLGALGGLVGLSGQVRTPADQYVALLQSTTVADRLIDEFGLRKVYDEPLRVDARRELADRVRIWVGKKDGLIYVEVDDRDPKRAAAIANRHVDELRRLGAQLALTEAQQRRVFFEAQLAATRDRLTEAQQALAASGFSAGALRAEPKAAAEGYARLKAEATAAEVRLQTLRRNLADSTPEVQQQLSALAALRAQLARQEAAATRDDPASNADYVGRYREFKYQETLFELLARQYELARLDESREGALIQVVDVAQPPEKRSRPKRAYVAVAATVASFLLLAGFFVARHFWRLSASAPATAAKVARLRAALGRG